MLGEADLTHAFPRDLQVLEFTQLLGQVRVIQAGVTPVDQLDDTGPVRLAQPTPGAPAAVAVNQTLDPHALAGHFQTTELSHADPQRQSTFSIRNLPHQCGPDDPWPLRFLVAHREMSHGGT